LLEINGRPPQDIIDYRLADAEEQLSLLIETPAGKLLHFDIEKETDEPTGLIFASEVFDGVRTCNNRCLFCFLDQMPPGLRDTLYVRDDDYRLSFLHGNFVTLSNITEEDLERILRLRLSPLHISVHATDEVIRARLLGVKKGRAILPLLRRLATGGIEMHTQIVISPRFNDGPILEKTVCDLAELHPQVASVSVVPVGLTKYRQHLPPVDPVTPPLAHEVIDLIDSLRRDFYPRLGTNFVYCADEMFIIAQREIPPTEYYEDFPQLENGVGLVRWFVNELDEIAEQPSSETEICPTDSRRPQITLVTGIAAFPWIQKMGHLVSRSFSLTVQVIAVPNALLGNSVTVAGLLCGQDILSELKGRDLGDIVFVPAVAVDGEGRFLDEITVAELAQALGTTVNASARWPTELVTELQRHTRGKAPRAGFPKAR